MSAGSFGRGGTTLVELLVVLAILGIIATVVGLSFAIVSNGTLETGPVATVQNARNEALRTGRMVCVTVLLAERPHAVTALPDGRVVADSALPVDLLTGRLKR